MELKTRNKSIMSTTLSKTAHESGKQRLAQELCY